MWGRSTRGYAIIANEPYSQTVMVRRSAEVRFVTRADFEDVMQASPSLYTKLLRVLAAEIRAAHQAFSEIGCLRFSTEPRGTRSFSHRSPTFCAAVFEQEPLPPQFEKPQTARCSWRPTQRWGSESHLSTAHL